MKPFSTKSLLLMSSTLLGRGAVAASFGDDLAFLKQHREVVVLSHKTSGARAAVAPAWQGRLVTTSADGDTGYSFGWINRELIASGKTQPHINVYGGEDRFWIGPEGGQFSVFFAKGAAFDLEHWFTPAPIDTLPYKLAHQSATPASFVSEFSLTNFSGTRFDLPVDRQVPLLTPADAWRKLGVPADASVKLV